jgi:hypothetical protein
MEIIIKWQNEDSDGSEYFDSVEDAVDYLENLNEDEDEYYNPGINYDIKPDKISISIKSIAWEEVVQEYLNNGYELTYTGKTGVTLERIK